MDTLITTKKSISSLIQDFAAGNIAVPEIQRDVVWSPEQVKDLLDSVSEGYPCGSLIFWEPRERDESLIKSIIRPERLEQHKWKLPQYFLLDGQQRLSALAAVLLDQAQLKDLLVELEEEMPIIYADLKNFPRVMEATTDDTGHKFPWVSVNRLFSNTFKITEDYQKRLRPEQQRSIDDFTQRVRDYTFPIQIIKGRSYADVAKIFARVNSQGTQLTGAEIHLASIVPHWPGITKEFRDYRFELRQKNYDLDLNFLMRAITVIECGVAQIKKLTDQVGNKKISKRHLNRVWRKAKSATDTIIRTLNDELELDKTKYFTSKNVLVPLVYYVAKEKDKSRSLAVRKMTEFFLFSQLGEHYGSGADTALRKDMRSLADPYLTPRQGLADLVDIVKKEARQYYRGLKIKKDDIGGVASKNVMLLIMYVLMRKRNACNFGPGKTLSLSDIAPKDLQLHHIFPFNFMMTDKAALKFRDEYDYSPAEFRTLVNDISNLTFVSQAKNIEIGDKPPFQYLPLDTNNELRKAHFIPEDRNLWRPERFWDFLEARSKIIAQAANSLLKYL